MTALRLLDLAAADGRCFSPYCWRARMALAHKGLAWQTARVRFTDIPTLGLGNKTVPVLVHGNVVVRESWDIAVYLDEHFAQDAPLFGSDGGRSLARFVHHWVGSDVLPALFPAIAADIYDRLDPADQPYFRTTREKRIGTTLETSRDRAARAVEDARKVLTPARRVLEERSFLGGMRPDYADHILFAALQWPRVISDRQILAPDDSVAAWFERCLDLYDGLGRREPAANLERQEEHQ